MSALARMGRNQAPLAHPSSDLLQNLQEAAQKTEA